LYVQVHAAYLAKDFPGSFLLEVSWPDGQMIKQFDIFPIDNNDIENSVDVELLHKQFQAAIDAVIKADSVSSLDVNKDINQQIQRLNNKQRISMPLVDKIQKTPLGGIEYSPVEEGESISKIAKLLAISNKGSVNQIMVTLFNENRHAFIDNNIHRLKIGITLKIENEDSIALMTEEEASRLAKEYMRNPGAQKEFSDSLIAGKAFSEEMIKSSDEKKIKYLEIISASEGLIPQDILKRIKAEELAKSEEEMRIANNQLQALQSKIMHLKKRIVKLESDTGFNEDDLFLENAHLSIDNKTLFGGSETVQDENYLVVSTDLSLEEKNSAPFMLDMETYKTTILFGGAALLSISLLGFRHKSWLSTLTQKIIRN